MSYQTPRQRSMPRPSISNTNTNSSPNLLERASTSMHRKASYNALLGGAPQTPGSKMLPDGDFQVGDTVNVPGDMFGTVRFVGSVKGKQGRFLGVELSDDFASRGKNSGDVEGVNYFSTTVPGSGIFLPIHRAEKRDFPAVSVDSFSASPQTPSYSKYRTAKPSGRTPPTPAVPRFSQTVGPGARPPSPTKPRQSLARPESPMRKPPTLQPTPGRSFSTSQRIGSRPPASPATGRNATPKLSASTRTPAPPRPYSRTGSRLGQRNDSISESTESLSRGTGAPSFSRPLRSPSRMNRSGDDTEAEQLREQLAEKDRHLREQAGALAEMEASLKEIQSLIPEERPANDRSYSGTSDEEGGGVAQLRQALNEKNEKIQSLIAEFDGHRADFRSTMDTLEAASNETERLYESKVAELMAEMQDLRDNHTSREEVEGIAMQLKTLEELVAELEEGLEDARRGEAEARGEVEFLRGEVERGRSELRREREKGAHTKQPDGAGEESDRQLEMKDDEIRGLKAIIHSLESGQQSPGEMLRNPSSAYSIEPNEIKRMQDSIQQLEQQNAELKSKLRQPPGRVSITATPYVGEENGQRSPSMPDMNKLDINDPNGHAPSKWCDACETDGHDMLECKSFFKSSSGHVKNGFVNGGLQTREEDVDDNDGRQASHVVSEALSPKSPQKEIEKDDLAAPLADQDKWCALCEQDGHLAFDCPNEQY